MTNAPSPSEIVQRQVEAYNARDLDTFVNLHSEDVELYALGGDPILRGRDALRARYRDRFDASPNLHAHIASRIAHGDFVVDHETVSGYHGDQTVSIVAIYRVRDGYIDRVWFIR